MYRSFNYVIKIVCVLLLKSEGFKRKQYISSGNIRLTFLGYTFKNICILYASIL